MQVNNSANKIIRLEKDYLKPLGGSIPRKYILVYFIWPLGSLYQALINFRKPWAKNLFWLFCGFFGLVFIVGEVNIRSNDALRYAEMLSYFHQKSLNFSDLLKAIYNPQEGFVDVFQPVITWFISIFTDNPKWLFTIFALIFGYFYSRNIWILLKYTQSKYLKYLPFLVIISFALLNPVWNINGVRMWTAAHIFVYGIFNFFLLNNQRSGIQWIILTPFIHFSFLFPLLIFFAYIILPSSLIVLFVFFVVTSFVKEIDIEYVRDQLTSIAPKIFEERIQGYTNIDYAQAIEEQTNVLSWHVRFAEVSFSIVLYTCVTSLFFFILRYKKKVYPILFEFFKFSLFIGSMANLSSNIPSGGRFLTLSNSFFIACIFIFLSLYRVSNNYMIFFKLLSVLLLFWIIFFLRIGLDYSGFLLFIGNPLIAVFVTESISIMDLIKELLI